ncbi:MAG: B12-binding domain-containing radical SAM protein, partial [Verrucomicrobia bacterium]|nr:B12-binding domain-containing radical SAM protein [Verrucomicrobiota bacterium]
MARIILTTLNAKYIHAAFGLRYLMANLGSLRTEARILEFDISQRPMDIVERLLAEEPTIVGMGVYIWNVAISMEVLSVLKRVAPGVTVVLGGPEVSYEVEAQAIVSLADYVVTGEADLKFAQLCAQILQGRRPSSKVIPSELPELSQLVLPYELYDDRDIAHRIIYVEASRGCPFTCEFCLSSLDVPVRQFPLARFLSELDRLLARGVKQFKFVDRTFNLNLSVSQSILEFFLERIRAGVFLHFEMVPDRLPDALRVLIQQFPPGTLQFEVGIQTFNEEVASRIKRRQNYRKVEENLRFLRQQTGVHIHADLIVGLPGESVESFGQGFDRLVALGPQEIQVGILKRLRGTPIMRHDDEWGMVYSEHAPYEILRTRVIDFAAMQRMRRFARYWDLVANSGNFIETTPWLWKNSTSPFASFMRWS